MNKIVRIGAVALMLGIVLVALWAVNGGNSAQAGGPTATLTSTPDPTFTHTPTPCGGDSKSQATCTPVPTQPPVGRNTRTPSPTATPPSTEVPPSITPAATVSAPSNTPVGSGVGSGIQGPDTGTGPGDSGSNLRLSWLLALGAALTLAGGAVIGYGMRRG